jgi:hypothetical protein
MSMTRCVPTLELCIKEQVFRPFWSAKKCKPIFEEAMSFFVEYATGPLPATIFWPSPAQMILLLAPIRGPPEETLPTHNKSGSGPQQRQEAQPKAVRPPSKFFSQRRSPGQSTCICTFFLPFFYGNKSLYLVFVGWFFSASWTAFRAVRTAAWTAFRAVRTAASWLFC